MIDAILTV